MFTSIIRTITKFQLNLLTINLFLSLSQKVPPPLVVGEISKCRRMSPIITPGFVLSK